jgi:alpha-tubulin suppressor-like RCC1 family protein
MAVTGTITTRFIDENGVDLGKQLIEKDYLIGLYPNLFPQYKTSGLYLWGGNSSGQLGDNTTILKSSPVQIGASSWTSIAGGAQHSVAIRNDGLLFAWGYNAFSGQVGDNTAINRSSPVQIGASSWTAIACGNYHSLAIRNDRLLFAWGGNSSGQLGDNTTINKSSPVQIGSSSWIAVAGGTQSSNSIAIRNDGLLFTWGYNNNGQLGDNTTIAKSSPVQIGANSWSIVKAGTGHSLAIRNDGLLFTWGVASLGQTGNDFSNTYPTKIPGKWSKISAGNTHILALSLT